MLLGRSTLANFSSACGSGCRVGLFENVNSTLCGDGQASGLHLNSRCIGLAERGASHLSGSGTLVEMRTSPGLSGASFGAVCACAAPTPIPQSQRAQRTQAVVAYR